MGLLVCDRAEVVDARVQPGGVVPIDPEQGRELERFDGAPWAFEIDELGPAPLPQTTIIQETKPASNPGRSKGRSLHGGAADA